MTWWFSTTDLFVIQKYKKNIALVVMLWCLTGNGDQLTTAPKPGMTFQLFFSAANTLRVKYKALGVLVAFAL